jgi:hypothetical protein
VGNVVALDNDVAAEEVPVQNNALDAIHCHDLCRSTAKGADDNPSHLLPPVDLAYVLMPAMGGAAKEHYLVNRRLKEVFQPALWDRDLWVEGCIGLHPGRRRFLFLSQEHLLSMPALPLCFEIKS